MSRKTIHLAEDGDVARAGEPLLAIIQDPQGDEMRFLKLESEGPLRVLRMLLPQGSIHPENLQRLLPKVVGFLCVQTEDVISHCGIRDQDGCDPAGAEPEHRLPPMVAVRGPVAAVRGSDRDDGVDETTDRPDHRFQALHVMGREIPLIGGGLHAVQRQLHQELPAAAIGIRINRPHHAPIRLHLLGQLLDLRRDLPGHGRFLPRFEFHPIHHHYNPTFKPQRPHLRISDFGKITVSYTRNDFDYTHYQKFCCWF
jgi:hypothetical protein